MIDVRDWRQRRSTVRADRNRGIAATRRIAAELNAGIKYLHVVVIVDPAEVTADLR